jgi:hypothetical protein
LIASQRIDLVRRSYNQWVADQTLEDYALRFTAKSARRWSAARVANTALGAISFLALEAIGAAITLNYGVANAVPAILAVSVIIFACGLPVAYFAAKGDVDIDLLTRGAGFGYIGSTITSLIYASFTFIFFAIEAVILATALDMCFGIPKPIGYLLGALAVIPLVTYGVTLISRFQLWTQPFWISLHVLPFAAIALTDGQAFKAWTHFNGLHGSVEGRFDLRLFGAAASVVFALVAQIGEQVDFLRFLPPRRGKADFRWWAALIAAGPGWIGPGALKLLAGSFLAYFALRHGEAAANAGDPAHMYLNAFNAVSGQPRVALVLTGLFVLLSQIKINVTNAYAGSIAWSNFFSRLTHAHPGRVVWLVFNVMVAVLLMEIGVYETMERTLALYSNVAVAWVGTLVADLVIVRPLGLRPPTMEFQRAYLYDVNPVGVGAMLAATLASILSFYGVFGYWIAPLAPFVSLVVAFAAAPALAWATGGKYYIARRRESSWNAYGEIKCTVCEHEFEAEDMGSCPAYAGPYLLALLLARCALRRSLQAACAPKRTNLGGNRRSPPVDGARPSEQPARTLPRYAFGHDGPIRPRALSHLPTGPERAYRQRGRVRSGAVARVFRELHHPVDRHLARGARAGEPARGGRGVETADRAAHEGDRSPSAHGRGAAESQGGGGGRQSRQEPVRRGPEPRITFSAQRDQRLCAASRTGPCRA